MWRVDQAGSQGGAKAALSLIPQGLPASLCGQLHSEALSLSGIHSPLPRTDLTHASHQPSPGWAGPQGEGRPADLQSGSGQQLPQGLLRLPDLQLRLPLKEGQRLSLFPPVRLQGGEEQPQDSLGPLPAAPTPPPAPWQGPRLRGQAVSPPRTGPLQSVPTGGLLPSPQPPCLGPAGALGFLPAPGSPPSLSTLGPLPLSLGGESCSRWTPKQKRPKADTPSGTPGNAATSAGRRTAALQEPQEGVAGRPALAGPGAGPAGHALGEGPFPAHPGGRAGPPACGARRQIPALPYPAPPAGVGGSPCLTLGHPPLGAGTPGCRHVAGAKNTGVAARQALAHRSLARCPGESASP